ncbi:unnamed protein product [Microthlaspi erraticum]|uniref:Uncharacterized protein n=1 Tax=Microthlaspi erraticum TaxID=1685480 RepID=A0A6D2KIZ3_9BRAS|nr:unnamed protein product [Microthlaspi erraticum]
MEKDMSGKRKRVEQENRSSQLNESSASSSLEEVVLPFAKTMRYWKEFESMEAFRITPQGPHFLPLLKAYDNSLVFIRESIAVGFMKGYSEYWNSETPVSKLMLYKEAIVVLEEYGFRVGELLTKIDEVLSVKDGQGNISEEPEKKMTDESTKEPKRNKSSNTTLSRCNTTLLRCKR